jgi:hypothetical protein
MNNDQRRAALRWVFYFFSITLSYLAIYNWMVWGKGAVEAGATAGMFLVTGLALDFFLRRAVIFVWAVLTASGFLAAWILLGDLIMRSWEMLITLPWVAGCIFGVVQSRRLVASKR